jgi:Leucine-rich repeat (LRR) protein
MTELTGDYISELSIQYPNLRILNLNRNNLQTLPKEISKLHKLEKLHLKYNKITALPQEISYLKYLTHLYLNNNYLTALPSKIGNLKNLSHLNLRRNEISNFPKQMVNLSNLKNLIITHNPVDELPVFFSELSNLLYINCRYTPVQIIPKELKNSKTISTLYSFQSENLSDDVDIIMLNLPDKMQPVISENFELFKTYAQKQWHIDIKLNKLDNQFKIEIIGSNSYEVAYQLEQHIDFVYQTISHVVESQNKPNRLKEKVRTSILKGDTDKALLLLHEHLKEKETSDLNTVILLKSHLERIKREERSLGLRRKDYYSELRKIDEGILNLLDYLE